MGKKADLMVTQEEILKKIQEKSNHPLLVPELLRILSIPREERRAFKKLLEELVEQGKLIRTRGHRYGLPQKMNLVIGRFKGHRDGYGFVIPEEPGIDDVYIGIRSREDAMHGDRVVARIESRKRDGRREGRIIRVLERAHSRFVGRYERDRGIGFVVSSDRRIAHDLVIPANQTGGATPGQAVVAQIIAYPTGNRNPQGKIIRILGEATDAGIDTEMVVEEQGLPKDFRPEVLAEADRIPERVQPEMIAERVDLRRLPTVTIDGEKARDFDDAVSIEALPVGGYRLFVHIADVGFYVAEGSLLDQEAYVRGTSVYFPDAVLPMFPERLSNGICSLNPHEDRLTLTAEMRFDTRGQRTGYKIYDSVIQSDERMTYTGVRRILVDKDPELLRRYSPLVPMFQAMQQLAVQLHRSRLERGSLDFDLPEPQIVLDLQGKTVNIVEEERSIAHRIIEEFMLAANETVAEHVSKMELPFLYRIHDEPDPQKMAAFNEFLHNLGLHLKGASALHPLALSEILEEVKDRPEERLINHVLLRSMKQARYSAENRGHFGLAAPFYTHFTSPIRRYPDLVVHRLLREIQEGKGLSPKRSDLWRERLPKIALHTSERERVAMEAEREVVQRRKVKFMAEKVGEEFGGFITGAAAYGFFVELESLFVEGLVHVTSLSDDYYLYREDLHALIGEHNRRSFRIGDPVRVRVERVSVDDWTIDFSLVEEDRPKAPGKGKSEKTAPKKPAQKRPPARARSRSSKGRKRG